MFYSFRGIWKRVKHWSRASLDRIMEVLGIAVYVRQPQHHYVPDYFGRKAAKHVDIRKIQPFARLAEAHISEGRTLLYYDRLFTIYQALVNVARLSNDQFATGFNSAEVGIYKGGGSSFITSVLAELGIKNARHYGFDTFEGHSRKDVVENADPLYSRHLRIFHDTSYETVSAYLAKYDNASLHKGRFQETAEIIQDRTFHFVHLDVDIYQPTVFALQFFDERLVVGGVILVDDYGFITCPGVKMAVDEFIVNAPHYFVLHHLTGQCVLVKLHDAPRPTSTKEHEQSIKSFVFDQD